MKSKKLFANICFLFFLLSPYLVWAGPMKFAYYDNYPPRSYKSEGKMFGIIIDIIDIAVKDRLGIKVMHKGYPWARAQEMVRLGDFDAFITVPTQQRRRYTIVSKEPLFKFENFIATTTDNNKLEQLKKITSVDQLKSFTMVDYLGNGWAKNVLKDIKVHWLPDYKSIFPFLIQGKADALIVSEVGIYSISKMGYQDKIIVLPQAVTSVAFHLCISKKSDYKEIIHDFDIEIKKMREEGIIKKIMDAYYE